MLFRQLFDTESSTYTYLLACETSRKAVLIDTVFEQHNRDAALLTELNLDLTHVLDTHIHADHVTGAWLMKERYGAEIVLAAVYEVPETDVGVADGDVIEFGECALDIKATPGHTVGCVTYVTRDRTMAFTGDCLMIRAAGRTDFQGGSVTTMWDSIREQIFTLPDECLVYPGHDYQGRLVSTVQEEREHNPRIGGRARKEDFVGYMNNLGLPHPKLLEIAVPANKHCGKPEEVASGQDWAPITITFGGTPEVSPEWVATHYSEVRILDVRSVAEFGGELGHLEDSLIIPLDELRERLDEVPRDLPVVTLCQTGKRSAMAADILRKAGVERVANIHGGLVQWQRASLPHCVTDQSWAI